MLSKARRKTSSGVRAMTSTSRRSKETGSRNISIIPESNEVTGIFPIRYPKKETIRVSAFPASGIIKRKSPSSLVTVPRVVPARDICAKGKDCFVDASDTLPFMDIFSCATINAGKDNTRIINNSLLINKDLTAKTPRRLDRKLVIFCIGAIRRDIYEYLNYIYFIFEIR